MSLTPGSHCGPYEIIGLLGTGGMGEVYRARDAKLGRNVAVKVLGIEAPASPATVRRFEQEARALSALNHPGIVTIHDVGECDGQFYIVMEIVEGTTLRHLLERGRPRLKKALQIAAQLADALAKAHEAGIVHRDLKPENVMLTGEGHVKIVDFGLARLAEPAAAGSRGPDRTATDRSTERMRGCSACSIWRWPMVTSDRGKQSITTNSGARSRPFRLPIPTAIETPWRIRRGRRWS